MGHGAVKARANVNTSVKWEAESGEEGLITCQLGTKWRALNRLPFSEQRRSEV
jgi:hypothetical protein